MKSILKFCQRYMEWPFWLYLNTKYHVTSKYHHAPKQVWQTRVFIQCRYGLSGVRLFNSTRVWQKPILFSWPLEKERALLDLADHKLFCKDHFETSCFEGNLMVILFICHIILYIWIYYTITFCRFTFCFYRLWQNKWIGGKVRL